MAAIQGTCAKTGGYLPMVFLREIHVASEVRCQHLEMQKSGCVVLAVVNEPCGRNELPLEYKNSVKPEVGGGFCPPNRREAPARHGFNEDATLGSGSWIHFSSNIVPSGSLW